MRRKFVDAMGKTTKGSLAPQGVSYCIPLFAIERNLSPEGKFRARQEKTQSVMSAFFDWLKSQYVLAGSQLGETVQYALNNEEGLALCFIQQSRRAQYSPHNSGKKELELLCKRSGAQANGIVYSLILTTKENGINPTRYFEYLFEKLPNLSGSGKREKLEKFLPWTKEVQAACQ